MTIVLQERKGLRGGLVDGHWYPSTSAILDLLHPPKMEFLSQEDLDRGSRCHELVARWLRMKQQGDLRSVWWDGAPDAEDLSRALAVIEWLDKRVTTIKHVEETLFSPTHKYLGTPDAVLVNDEDVDWTLDLKFAETIDLRYLVQVEAYLHFPETIRTRGLILQCDREGHIKAFRLKRNPGGWAAFQAARNVLAYRVSL